MKSPQTVLLIDDDQWLSAQLAKTLERAGYDVHAVAHALDGIAAIDQYKPAAIVLDVFMPGPNGIVLLHEMQSHGDLSRIPVIMCTNSAGDIPQGSLSHYGVSVVIDKTVMHPDDIVSAVRKVLS